MANEQDIQDQVTLCLTMMREKLGLRAADMTQALPRARRRLPRHVYKGAVALAAAEPLLVHPKLRLTLDTVTLSKAARDLQAYLDDIDLKDRRKAWWLGVLGGVSFNLIALAVVVIVVLVWRGYL